MPSCGVSPSVCPSWVSVTFVYSIETSNFCNSLVDHHSSFSVPNLMAVFRRGPLTWTKSVSFDRYCSAMLCISVACCRRAVSVCPSVCLLHSCILSKGINIYLKKFFARCYARAAYAAMRCLSVCLSVRLLHSWILSKRINIHSKFVHHRVATPFSDDSQSQIDHTY